MSKYLVTGGAGFIGSHVAQRLVEDGEQVVVLDNLSAGRRENLAAVQDSLTFTKGDIRDEKTAQQACRGVDYVLHLAAYRSVPKSVDDPRSFNDVNINGTLNMLLAARDQGVARFVFSSSSSVYGQVTKPLQMETMRPKPVSPYALSKLVGEHYCRLFSQLYDLDTVSLRYFNVFGPRQNPESQYSAVIPIFVTKLLQGETTEIDWHGRQKRDFTYVANVVEANKRAAGVKDKQGGRVYNIGNGQSTSIRKLYDILQELLGTNIEPLSTPKRSGDVLKTHADVSKAASQLGWRPSVSFTDGLKESIDWYREQVRERVH